MASGEVTDRLRSLWTSTRHATTATRAFTTFLLGGGGLWACSQASGHIDRVRAVKPTDR
jgi:hypothetical protein